MNTGSSMMSMTRTAHGLVSVAVLLAGVLLMAHTSSGSQVVMMEVTSDVEESLKMITEGEVRTVHVNYSVSEMTDNTTLNLFLFLCAFVEDTDIASVQSEDDFKVTSLALAENPYGQFNFSVRGHFLGRTKTRVRFIIADQNEKSHCKERALVTTPFDLSNEFNLTNIILWPGVNQTELIFEGDFETAVQRELRPIDTLFRVGVVIAVLIVNLGVGCKSELSIIKESFRRPVAPVIGLCCQFIIMPLIAYTCVRIFEFGPALALGFFALGCSPGGSASNAYTMLLEGDVSLSITMTFSSTLASLGMIPLWLLTLGRTLYADTDIRIPYQNILYSLLGLLVPVGLGLLIKHRRPRWAKTLVKVSKVMMVVFLIYVTTLGVYTNLYIFKLITWQVLVTSAVLPYGGFFLGGLVAFLTRMPTYRVLTVAVETGIQNTGIAIVLLLLTIGQPESDISIVAPVISAIFTPFPLWVAIAVVQGRKRCSCKDQDGDGEGESAREKVDDTQFLKVEKGGEKEGEEGEEVREGVGLRLVGNHDDENHGSAV